MFHSPKVPELGRITAASFSVSVSRHYHQHAAFGYEPEELLEKREPLRQVFKHIYQHHGFKGRGLSAVQLMGAEDLKDFLSSLLSRSGIDLKPVTIPVRDQPCQQPSRTATKVKNSAASRKRPQD
jgi:hypothetical protein